MFNNTPFIFPHWEVPSSVHAYSTTRILPENAVSGCYNGFNLGLHTGDLEAVVLHNRRCLIESLALPREPSWVNQVHGSRAVHAEDVSQDTQADAVYTSKPGVICCMMTADCLPILMTDAAGGEVAAIHAGWRGLYHGVIENTVKLFQNKPSELRAWLGPAIGSQVYEVGHEIYTLFTEANPEAKKAFLPKQDKWLLNMPMLAQQYLERLGVYALTSIDACTYSDPARYFSYRREQNTGRMATLIWRE